MAKPVMTSEMLFEHQMPDCPHCAADMSKATVSLERLLEAWPIESWVATGYDGYVRPLHDYLEVECPHCARPSVMVIHDHQVKLFAARTEKDQQLEGSAVNGQGN
jgi:Zn finger protein HypA/HybF involved in hydrogenase expression